jgi:pyruvate-ferredoxin/flavodoxin oxidoreductase
MDLSPVAHICALVGSLPFINFFEGFRTSHELQKISVWDYSSLASLYPKDSFEAFRRRFSSTHCKYIYGSAQNPDVFFQNREAANPYYNALPDIVENTITQINDMLGTSYGLVDYYGAPDARHVIIAMGSVCNTIREYLQYNDNGVKNRLGLISIHLYRPFPTSRLITALPSTVEQISVLTRSKEPGSPGDALYLDVLAALSDSRFKDVSIYSGRYGLGSKDTTPSQIAAVYKNISKKFFTIGIEDDVTHLSLPSGTPSDTETEASVCNDSVSCMLWGLGGDGTVSASKNILKIIGDNTPLKVQGYFEYDSKKSGGLTISHLRYGEKPILSSYLIDKADILVCTCPEYLYKYDLIKRIKDGGTLLLNISDYTQKAVMDYLAPFITSSRIRLFTIDAQKIGLETGLNGKISTIIQAAFFALPDISKNILGEKEAEKQMIEYACKTYKKAGEKVLAMNRLAIHRGLTEVREYKTTAKRADSHFTDIHSTDSHFDDSYNESANISDKNYYDNYADNILLPILQKQGDTLPVSAFLPYASGACITGTSALEKKLFNKNNVANNIPIWKPENCIQCNRCSLSCPHAVIRPILLSDNETIMAPKDMYTIPAIGSEGYHFTIAVSAHDCTGCGACVGICPGKGDGKKALDMLSVNEYPEATVQECFDYAVNLPAKPDAVEKFKRLGVKSSQFEKPLMEFSGACAGCGETPYVKLLTQLFGSKLYIANATGCSSIWANSYPLCAYCADENGNAPFWSNSLFEDAAEFGYGMLLAHEVIGDTESVPWIIGGDGWAYDIGFGGVDHVLSSGKNINILVLDTECYSNTGGQASKATPAGASAKFATGGKRTSKKNLAAIALTYRNVYVASVAMGADIEQTVKAFKEAAAYTGPSIIIAYATCIAHGLKSGMGSSFHEEKKAVDAGYVSLFRYNPTLAVEGKNPMIIDSKFPDTEYAEFLKGENRYKIIAHDHPDVSGQLFAEAASDAKERYMELLNMQKSFEL